MSAPVETQQQKERKDILAQLEKLGGQTVKQDDVTFEGRRIVLPEGTTLTENARFLAQLAKDQEEITSWFRSYTYKPWDVAYCLQRAFKRVFGAMRHSGTSGFFASPPTFVEIPSGPNEVVQVPQGEFSIPHLPGVTFEVGTRYDEEWGLVGYVSASGPKREGARVNGIFEVIREELGTASLYRGKAIEYGDMPNFIDVDRIDPSRIVYSAEVEAALNTHVMAKMRYPDELAEEGVGFRMKVLLSGEFGVGKTEALRLVAKEAQKQGYTYIVVPKDESNNILDAMKMARAYEPCVVACEDVDTLTSAELESSHISRVLDAFDGSQAKSSEVMVLLTTNYAEQIQAGMLRPGRIDRMIVVREPDAAGIRRLIEVNVKRLADDINWDAVTASMEGYHPAFVVRVATDAVEYATVRQLEDKRPKEERLVTSEDLIAAAVEIRPQFDMHVGARRHATPPQTIDNAVRKVVTSTLEDTLDERVLLPKE